MPQIERKYKPVTIDIDIDGYNLRFLSFDGDDYSGNFIIKRPYWDDNEPVHVYASSYQPIADQLRALADTLEELANA